MADSTTSAFINSSTNTTTYDSGDEDDIKMTQRILLCIIFLIVLIFICGGNLLTILAVWTTPALRTVPNMYVVSLAVVDFCTGAIIPYYCVSFFPTLRSALDRNKYLCLFRYVLFHICVAESLACMLIISFDRFLFIKYPLHYKSLTSKRKAGVVIAASLVVSTLLGSVPLWNNNWGVGGHCDGHAVLTETYRVYVLAPGFYVCCLLTAIFYGYIVNKAMKHQRQTLARRMSQLGSSNTQCFPRSDWKSIKVFLLVYGVFFVCWCPNFTLLIVRYFMPIPRSLVYFTVILGFLNSGMNFVIYAWQNQHFRGAFKRFLCGKQRRAPLTAAPTKNHVELKIMDKVKITK